MKACKVSVAMTCFNGEKYIIEQLDSIAHQTKKPDEVIIVDDCSSDSTTKLIESFIANNGLSNWHLFVNQKNVGWKMNFYNAAKKVTGDIVFFSDQDDVWEKTKIEEMCNVIANKGAKGVYCSSSIIDEAGNYFKKRNYRSNYTSKISRIPFSNSFIYKTFLGCRACFTKDVINKYLDLSFPEGGHDSQCGRISLLFGSLWLIDKPLIRYRVHENNSSGISQSGSFGYSSVEKRIATLLIDRKWLDILISDDDASVYKPLFLKLTRMIDYRLSYLKKEKHRSFFGLLKFISCYTNITMLLGDFSYRHGINIITGDMRWKIGKIANGFTRKGNGKKNTI